MNSDSSEPTEIVIPAGRVGLISSASAFARSATSSVLAPDWRTIPRPIEFWPLVRRSEEHTSELQSLMRISYAVFCLNKKIKFQKLPSHIISVHHSFHIDFLVHNNYMSLHH